VNDAIPIQGGRLLRQQAGQRRPKRGGVGDATASGEAERCTQNQGEAGKCMQNQGESEVGMQNQGESEVGMQNQGEAEKCMQN